MLAAEMASVGGGGGTPGSESPNIVTYWCFGSAMNSPFAILEALLNKGCRPRMLSTITFAVDADSPPARVLRRCRSAMASADIGQSVGNDKAERRGATLSIPCCINIVPEVTVM